MVDEGNVDVLTGIAVKVNHHGVPAIAVGGAIHDDIQHLGEIGFVGAGDGDEVGSV